MAIEYAAFIGGKEIEDFYVGGKQIDEIYGGNTLLWKKEDTKREFLIRTFVREHTSKYGPETINMYGFIIDINEDAKIDKIGLVTKVVVTRDTCGDEVSYTQYMCVVLKGENIIYARAISYIGYEVFEGTLNYNIYYDGLSTDGLNVYDLNKNENGVWIFEEKDGIVESKHTGCRFVTLDLKDDQGEETIQQGILPGYISRYFIDNDNIYLEPEFCDWGNDRWDKEEEMLEWIMED